MLICPQCNFENPNTNKFCQNCGASLTDKPCPECGEEVPVNAEQCHSCGAFCGTIWSAIIAPNLADKIVDRVINNKELASTLTSDQLELTEPTTKPTPPPPFPTLAVGEFLDPQKRYRLLEPLDGKDLQTSSGELYLRVLDSQPFQVTFLHALLANQTQELSDAIASVPGIPSLAEAYLGLQSYCNLGIPVIHDAWQQGNIQVVLVEERSQLPHISELWQKEQTTLLQIVHYFYQMSQLWEILEPFACRQSLLSIDNLRFDEDQALCLQRLYAEDFPLSIAEQNDGETTETNELSLQILGRIWHKLFKQSQRTQFGALIHLLGDMEMGDIPSLEALQSRLQAIAQDLEPIPENEEDVT